MTDWQNALRNRKDQLITGINQSRREIDRLAAIIATINGNIALDQDELDAVERALTPVPDGRLTREEVAKRIEATNAENKLVGMTDERVKG